MKKITLLIILLIKCTISFTQVNNKVNIGVLDINNHVIKSDTFDMKMTFTVEPNKILRITTEKSDGTSETNNFPYQSVTKGAYGRDEIVYYTLEAADESYYSFKFPLTQNVVYISFNGGLNYENFRRVYSGSIYTPYSNNKPPVSVIEKEDNNEKYVNIDKPPGALNKILTDMLTETDLEYPVDQEEYIPYSIGFDDKKQVTIQTYYSGKLIKTVTDSYMKTFQVSISGKHLKTTVLDDVNDTEIFDILPGTKTNDKEVVMYVWGGNNTAKNANRIILTFSLVENTIKVEQYGEHTVIYSGSIYSEYNIPGGF